MLRLIRPRLVHLPKWWPARFGAWAYLNTAFIGPGLLDATDDVRRYVVGHEYGHIYSKHTLLHLIYALGFASFALGGFAHMLVPLALGFLMMAVVSFLVVRTPLSHNRECQADDVAVLVLCDDGFREAEERALRDALSR